MIMVHLKGDVTVVFRSFHSLKGTSFGMGLENIAKLAHVSEDILGLVRDHGASINEDVFNNLTEALETISDCVEKAIETQKDVNVPADIVNKLKQNYQELSGGGSSDNSNASQNAGEAQAGDDDDEMMGIFCESAKEYLIQIYEYLQDQSTHSEEDIDDAIGILMDGSEMLDMEEIKDNLSQFKELLSNPQEAMEFFTDTLFFQFDLLFEIAGVEPLELGPALSVAEKCNQIVEQLKNISSSLKEEDDIFTKDIEKITAFLQQNYYIFPDISKLFLQLSLDDTATNIDIMYDFSLRVANGTIEPKVEISTIIEAFILLLESLSNNDGQLNDEGKNHQSTIQLLIDFMMDKSSSDEGETDDILAVFDIDEIYGTALSGEQIKDIFQKVAQGYFLYGIEAFPDRDQEIGSKLLEWLQVGVQLVNNKTIFANLETGFEFLVLSKKNQDALEKELLGLDKNKKILSTLSLFMPNQQAQSIDLQSGAIADKKTQKEKILRIPLTRVDEIVSYTQVITHHLHVIEEAVDYINKYATIHLKNENIGKTEKFNQYIEALRSHKITNLISTEASLATNRVHNITEVCSNVRLMPLEQMLQRIPRSTKILAEQLGKKINVTIESDPVNIDNEVFETLSESMLHLIRNALDHGLELPEEREKIGKASIGSLKVIAKSYGEELLINIIDDGKGINHNIIRDKAISNGTITEEQARTMIPKELVKLILRPNFSTAETVSQVSGRGVGMDVVNSNIQFLGGELDIITEVGKGSTFSMRVPLQSTLQRLVLFESGGLLFAVPEMFVHKIIMVSSKELLPQHTAIGKVDEQYMRIISISSLFQLPINHNKGDQAIAIIIKTSTSKACLLIDKIIGNREIFLQKTNKFFTHIPFIQKATVVGADEIPLILDIFDLLRIREINPVGQETKM